MRKALDSDLQLDMFYQQRNEETKKALEAANRLSAGGNPDDYEEAQVVSDQEGGQDEQSEQCTDEAENAPESEENAPEAGDIA